METLVPYRKPKRSYVLPVITTLAVAAPLAALTMSDSPDYRSATDTELAAVPAQLAEVVLNSAPDIVLPLRELTGLDLPDLRLSDLRMLPLPASIPIPEGLPLPPGVELPKEIPLPKLNGPHPATPGQQSAPGQNSTPGLNATPGQGIAPGQTPFPGQAATPGQAPLPGQATAPNRNAIPGQGAAPNQNLTPGQAIAPNQNAVPGQAVAPNPNTVPGQAAAPAQNTFPGQAVAPSQSTPGQATAPAQNPAPAQATAPAQNAVPGQTAGPGQNPIPSQAAAPGQAATPGQAIAPSQNPVPGRAAAPIQNPAPGQAPNAGQPAQAPTYTPGARFIADPSHLEPGTTPDTPALAPGAVPPEWADQVGAQVKELSRETPFSVVALTGADLTNTKALLRARQTDGTWGPWLDTEPVDTRRTDRTAPGGKTGTEPIYVGTTNAVQMLVTRKPAAAAVDDAIAPDPANPPAPRTDDPAQLAGVDLTAVLIDPGRGAIDSALHKVAAPVPGGGGPKVITREGWGADESIRCEEPTYDDGPGKDGLGGITVHHTAGRNDYSREESAGIVRAIYTYHAQTLGWCDIGYNALVDKYGQIFEGRAGGLNRAVQGAHAGGFNENTAGVALMGNYTSEEPSEESIEAMGNFIGWRAKIAGLDPVGYTTMYSEGTEFTSYALGQAVQLPIVFAHRDVGNTSCPGDAAYDMMDRIREIAASVAGGASLANSGNGDSYANNSTGTEGTANSTTPQAAPRGKPDLAALAALTKKLLSMVNDNAIAKHWADKGGPSGPLGAAQTEPLPAAQGQQYAKFANGYVYTAPDGKVIEVLGAILDRFLQLGGDAGVLGLPQSDAYPVPDGLRSDFQYGSLILNQATGIVTTVWKTYNDLYQQEASRPAPAAPAPAESPAPAAVPAPKPAIVPAPSQDSAPAESPAPAEFATPEPGTLQFPAPEDFLPHPAPEPAG
ncbi:N-acetylmuramoyl-L-alanine amidase [Nocardia sp. CS682]|uniref:N-acetylmuramoyl-L-alanine amidase n=1 Tax=Nocardia sp. CS682 TaxID=1047172 RepID=UPI00351A2A9C